MDFVIKEFKSLSAEELFEIYKLRNEIFIVEQNCAYQDVDEKDLTAVHVMMFDNGQLCGYSRILRPSVSYTEPPIGRVALKKIKRNNGSGKVLMQQSINKTLELFTDQDIVISAQSYLLTFYTGLGFSPEGKEYFEDNIPHIKMRLARI